MANIEYWRLDCDTIRPIPVVNGVIHLEGQFSWEEWVAIREMCFRMRRNPVPKPTLPSKGEIVARIQAGENPTAVASELTKKLKETPQRLLDSAPAIDV